MFTSAGLWFTRGRGNSSLLLANFACEEKKVILEVMRKLETEVEPEQKKPTMKQVHGVFSLLPSIAMVKKVFIISRVKKPTMAVPPKVD